jgi:hypothetical protein
MITFFRRDRCYSNLCQQEISAEESAHGNSQFARRVGNMNTEIRDLENETTRIGRERQNARGHRKAELAVIESTKE